MSYSDKIIKEYLINGDTKNKTVQSIADELYVSRSAVYYTLNKMGFNSYAHFKYIKYNVTEESEHDEQINPEIINKIINSKRIYLYATHASCLVNEFCRRQLINLEFDVTAIEDEYMFHKRKQRFSKDDCLIIISGSGENELINHRIVDADIPKIAITKRESSLTKLVDYNLYYDSTLYNQLHAFDRENMFPLITVSQNLLIEIKSIINQNK